MMKQDPGIRSMSSRRTAEQTSTMSRAARFFSALRVFFLAGGPGVPVCPSVKTAESMKRIIEAALPDGRADF